LTGGHRLAAGHVIHTVGPVWRGGHAGEREILAACYRNCLVLAHEAGLRSIAFPAIATGVYGFPRDDAAQIAVTTVQKILEKYALPETVIFVCFDELTHAVYRRILAA
jgi:O-acetyl-ADP-ribose deacetylase (regulator of RNase III)